MNKITIDRAVVGWMQKSTGVICCDWGFDKTGYVPVYAAQEQPA